MTSLEFARRGIRGNAICPDVIQTSMLERFLATDPAAEAHLGALEPIGRFATPEEAVQSVMWLCSDAASFVAGVALPVDGGWTVQ